MGHLDRNHERTTSAAAHYAGSGFLNRASGLASQGISQWGSGSVLGNWQGTRGPGFNGYSAVSAGSSALGNSPGHTGEYARETAETIYNSVSPLWSGRPQR